MVTNDTLKHHLKTYFGHEDFKAGQKVLIDAVLSGRDAVGIMPTGGGKSVCYQLPATIFGGVTIVISPLISLMKDQIHSLKENGIAAAYINSTLTDSQIDSVLRLAGDGKYKIIYVAPERLKAPRFLAFCREARIPFVAVDEAHCVSQWGQDFRPAYAEIPAFINALANRPVVAAFTATATERVREDIVSILRLNAPLITVNGFDRENLFFEVRHPRKRYDELAALLSARAGQYGIVYCATRKVVEELCSRLNADGFLAKPYHAGLSASDRHESQDDFIYDRIHIVVATNAFGMGIDKSNVSFVIHYNMPKDVESYYQEAGRAGRDGMPADCILLYSGQDLRTNLFLIENAEGRQYESEAQKTFLQEQERRRLKEMDLYCQTNSCLRNYILKYFGETPQADCGNCGNCNKETGELNITLTAQKILSCVVRTKELYGKNTIIEILRGSQNEKIRRAGLNRLSTYGICTESEAELKEVVHYLIEHGYLTLTDGQYPLMRLGSRANEVLRDKCTIIMPHAHDINARGGRKKGAERTVLTVQYPELYARLKECRRATAAMLGVPPYVVFHDRTLQQMCERLPGNADAFSALTGVGARKLEAYGALFLREIAAYAAENGLVTACVSSGRMPAPKREQPDYSAVDTTGIMPSDGHVPCSEIAARIKPFLEERGYPKISVRRINDWLTEQGLLSSQKNDKGHNTRRVTGIGKMEDIIEEKRIDARGATYYAILLPPVVQQRIIDNIGTILEFIANLQTETE